MRPRTQSSLAVTVDGARFLLINASPDVRQQIAATPALWPAEGLRHSPISAVLVTNGDVDHVAGLLTLRERQGFDLYGTAKTLGEIAANSIFSVMAPDCVAHRPVALDRPFAPLDGLEVTLFAVPGKVPLWREEGEPEVGGETEDTVGVDIRSGSSRLVYVPGCAHVTADVRDRIGGAGAVLFDGTVFADDEMIRAGLGTKTGARMGHVAMWGPDGSVAGLADVAVGRRVFVHINNSNPALIEGSEERGLLEAAGWEVAHDGLEVPL